ncbi:hypothetical protein ANO11243_082630 [Dothideomycetidae sp. 11243]|nr:hypothetical protein ANO11243_082630 [fungal sp. No.11243]
MAWRGRSLGRGVQQASEHSPVAHSQTILMVYSIMGNIGHDISSSGVRMGGTIYFGYGSNLWRHQMQQRCPHSKYLGVARLNGYRWMINDRGYANVVEMDKNKQDDTHCFGLVYSLTQSDEDALDINEGVPEAYTKEHLKTDFWRASTDSDKIDIDQDPEKVDMLVYIDRVRMEDSTPKSEYVYRMNMGIADARAAGVPDSYIDDTLRKFIPDKHDESAEKLARKQALNFTDE